VVPRFFLIKNPSVLALTESKLAYLLHTFLPDFFCNWLRSSRDEVLSPSTSRRLYIIFRL